MRDMRQFLIVMIGAVLFIADVDTAQADRRIVVLLDATGSMLTPRKDPTCADPSDPTCPVDHIYPTRFDAAKGMANAKIQQAAGVTTAGNLLIGVRVFVFHTLGAVNGISEVIPTDTTPALPTVPGWYIADAARQAILALPPPDGLTPLAYSLCKAGDAFLGLNDADSVRDLQTFTDGGENTSGTIPVPNCYFEGPDWQTGVFNHLLLDGVAVVSSTTLFTSVSSPLAARSASMNPELAALVGLGRTLVAALVSDEEFFRNLAAATGGTFSIVGDNQHVPVYADMNGDSTVGRDDAILLARKLGEAADASGLFDLDGDGLIDFDDYRIVVSNISQPDPYVPRGPVRCRGAKQIVIDGQSIESAGITIDARGSCDVVIKNSLIVSGQNAITIIGSTSVTVDDSIIVGQNAVLVQQGASLLSAARSVFHGKLDVKGAFKYIDRGGNVFE